MNTFSRWHIQEKERGPAIAGSLGMKNDLPMNSTRRPDRIEIDDPSQRQMIAGKGRHPSYLTVSFSSLLLFPSSFAM
jgi:hypothetical protein